MRPRATRVLRGVWNLRSIHDWDLLLTQDPENSPYRLHWSPTSHLSDEDPDEPEAPCQSDQDDVEQEVEYAVALARHDVTLRSCFRDLNQTYSSSLSLMISAVVREPSGVPSAYLVSVVSIAWRSRSPTSVLNAIGELTKSARLSDSS